MSIVTLDIATKDQGLHDITDLLQQRLEPLASAEGLCTLFIQHTSASLLIQENYDPTAKDDLENWLNRLVPERDPLYSHTLEGPDDMPAHIKSALTTCHLAIPIVDHRLALGTWQGVFVWEHRHGPHRRKIVVHLAA